jgi:hypothetical protein
MPVTEFASRPRRQRDLGSNRRLALFGAGPPKSGTHSIEGIFKQHYRAAHEPRRPRFIELVLAHEYGWIDRDMRRAMFLDLVRRMDLEVVASHHMVHFVDLIRDHLRHAKVVLTIRNCYAWLDSIFNHELNRVTGMRLSSLRDLRYGRDRFVHAPEEQVLRDVGLYTLDGYLSYWKWHLEHVIAEMPRDRLLVVRTRDLQARLEEIAAFSGVPSVTLSEDRSHEYKARRKHHMLERIDRKFLEAKVARHAGELMARFFPDITSLEDAGLGRTLRLAS